MRLRSPLLIGDTNIIRILVFEWKGNSEELHTKLNYCSNSKEIGHETTKKSAIILAGCIYFDSESLEHAHTLP